MRLLPPAFIALALGSSALAGDGSGCTAQVQKAVPTGFNLLFAHKLAEGCLIVSNRYDSRFDKQVSIQMLNPAHSSPRWQLILDGNAFGNDRDGRGWGIVNGVLWMQGTDSWEMWFSRNYGIHLADGKVIWNEVYGSAIRVDPRYIVMTKTQTPPMFADAQELKLTVFDFEQKKLRDDFVFTIPERPGCGDTHDALWEDAAYGAKWADQQFLYARRKDRCGVFVARFDWHGAAKQKATIFPK
ncbi:hypothetical protein HLB42_10075 [Deinococcus sp. D7000]|nr:hypothetical protein HLB42_10075 [Deinococcus sp. D7000]